MAFGKVRDLQSRINKEKQQFEKLASFSALPDITNWWSANYLRPRVTQIFGTENPYQFYAQPISEKAATAERVRVLSLGTGDGEVELRIANRLQKAGITNVSLYGLELSAALVAKANSKASEQGLAAILQFSQGDLNQLSLQREWDFIIANQILHHVLELESMFDEITRGLTRGGLLLTRDMIGKNGHQAWPEALSIVHPLWDTMPRRYKYHHQHKKVYERFPNLDFSDETFEGIRAQDILPLMTERFHFPKFLGYGGIAERFISRGFGPNYEVANSDDIAFVKKIQAITDQSIDDGIIKPTQMVAYVSVEPCDSVVWQKRTPGFCVRKTP
jgi:2-polyprenyl-3-methyl-5-hydroxy-6-metoxy-1,4-benzoquinol methylase